MLVKDQKFSKLCFILFSLTVKSRWIIEPFLCMPTATFTFHRLQQVVFRSSLPKKEDFFPHIGLIFVPKACFVPLPSLSVQVGHVLRGAFCTKPCRSQSPLLIFKCRFYFISDISSCIMFSNICTFFYICWIVYFKEIKFPNIFFFFSFFFWESVLHIIQFSSSYFIF